MNLLECTKVNTFFEFTKQNKKIFKKKFISFCKREIFALRRVVLTDWSVDDVAE